MTLVRYDAVEVGNIQLGDTHSMGYGDANKLLSLHFAQISIEHFLDTLNLCLGVLNEKSITPEVQINVEVG